MNTVAWVLILVAGLLVRGMTKGRSITQLPGDLGEMFNALVSGDQASLATALGRTGDSQVPTTAESPVTAAQAVAAGPGGGSSLLGEMKRLGAGKPYVWGGTGPNGYDCSGIVWRAMKNLALYSGPRFTTLTFIVALRSSLTKVNSPQAGDVVWWPTHMGVCDGKDSFYSALSRNGGIKSVPISAMPKGAIFYRLNMSFAGEYPGKVGGP